MHKLLFLPSSNSQFGRWFSNLYASELSIEPVKKCSWLSWNETWELSLLNFYILIQMVYEPLEENFNREDDIKYIYCFSYSYWVPGTVVGSVYITKYRIYIFSIFFIYWIYFILCRDIYSTRRDNIPISPLYIYWETIICQILWLTPWQHKDEKMYDSSLPKA